MKVGTESYGHAVMLNIDGEITEDTLSVFRQSVDPHVADAEVVDIVLNMESVPFVDSAALEYLLDVQDELAAKFGRVKLVKCDENVRKIMEITRLDRTFEEFSQVADAVKSVQT